MPRAPLYKFELHQGDTLEFTVAYQDEDGNAKDLTGYTARLTIRETKTSDTAIFNRSSAEGTTADGLIAIPTPADGVVSVKVNNSITKTMTKKKYVYDLEIVRASDGLVKTLLSGDIEVEPEVAFE